jgi:hypothetical protein
MSEEASQPPTAVRGFKGLNNRIDPTALGLEWQVQADNLLCDDAGYLVRRPGLQALSSGLRDLYGRRDGRMLGVTTGDVLVEIAENGAQTPLFAGMLGGPFQWTELGYTVFAMSETHAWAIYPNRLVSWGIPSCPPPGVSGDGGEFSYRIACVFVAPDGRQGGTTSLVTAFAGETGGIIVTPPTLAGYQTRTYASTPDGTELYLVSEGTTPFVLDALTRGVPLSTLHHYPPPLGGVIGDFHSRLAVGVWEPELDRSVIYFSQPDNPHVFQLDSDFQIVAGRVTALVSVPRAIIIGTDRAIYIDPIDEPVQRVAEYGVLPGGLIQDDRGVVEFWTQRGLCVARPFKNLTDERMAVAVREKITAAFWPWQGSQYAVVAQQGRLISKQRTRAHEPLSVSTTHTQGIT